METELTFVHLDFHISSQHFVQFHLSRVLACVVLFDGSSADRQDLAAQISRSMHCARDVS
jgi:hypothetical protein